MLSSSYLAEYDAEEYTPLLPEMVRYRRGALPLSSDSDSDRTDSDSDDDSAFGEEDDAAINKRHEWLFRLINWSQIFDRAASHLNIDFTDYDYDRYTSVPRAPQDPANSMSSVDTFNYFLANISNHSRGFGEPSEHSKHSRELSLSHSGGKHGASTDMIFSLIYDRVAKSRLFSLKQTLDGVFPALNVMDRVLAEIVAFELAPAAIRHLLYRSIIAEYHKRCRPEVFKTLVLVSNWLVYLCFLGVHIIWLQFVWVDFLRHFDWRDADNQHPEHDPQHADDEEPTPDDADGGVSASADADAEAHIFARSIEIAEATPWSIMVTMAKWSYFQWTTAALFVLLCAYMLALYLIARRVDAFGDFLKKLQLTQLLKVGDSPGAMHTERERDRDRVLLQFAAPASASPSPSIPAPHSHSHWGLDSDASSDSDVDSASALTLSKAHAVSPPMDGLSTKLIGKIEGLYFEREHLLLFSVISLVKMLIILLYLSCLLLFFLVPSASYWYLWGAAVDAFALYTLYKAAKQLCRGRGRGGVQAEAQGQGVAGDGILKNEWVVATANIVCVALLLVVSTQMVSATMSDSAAPQLSRASYLCLLGAVETAWFGSQLALWKLGYYGTIFYLLLLIPSILFGSAAFYALYEYYILSLVHTFLAVIFACGEFHLVGPHDDDTTLDPSDWSVLGVLALLAKLFRFRLPQQQPQST